MFVVAVHTDTDHFESGRIICDTGALQRRIWTPAVVLKVRAEVCKSLVYVYVHLYKIWISSLFIIVVPMWNISLPRISFCLFT